MIWRQAHVMDYHCNYHCTKTMSSRSRAKTKTQPRRHVDATHDHIKRSKINSKGDGYCANASLLDCVALVIIHIHVAFIDHIVYIWSVSFLFYLHFYPSFFSRSVLSPVSSPSFSSFLFPLSSFLIPHSSFLIPHSSFLSSLSSLFPLPSSLPPPSLPSFPFSFSPFPLSFSSFFLYPPSSLPFFLSLSLRLYEC